jgi:hypothetical protein
LRVKRLDGDLVAEALDGGVAAGAAADVGPALVVAGPEVVVDGVVAGQDVPVALCPPRGLRRPFRVLG